MTLRSVLVSGGLLSAGLASAVVAQSAAVPPGTDTRIEAQLESAELEYTIDEDGDFRLEYALPDGRTQVVWVASRTSTLYALEMRDLWSVAMRSRGAPSAELANRLLQDNAARILGAWQVQRSGDEYLVLFSAQLPATADLATVVQAMEAVMATADAMEKDLTGSDEF